MKPFYLFIALVALVGCRSVVPVIAVKPTLRSRLSSDQPAVFVAGGSIAWASDVKVAWTDNGSPGYNLYYGTNSGQYDQVIPITNSVCTVSNLVSGVTYYFSATSVDNFGDESDFSQECVYVMPIALDISFAFNEPVTNIVVQNSTDLATWQESNARLRSNGLWRVNVDTPLEFYRALGQAVPAL